MTLHDQKQNKGGGGGFNPTQRYNGEKQSDYHTETVQVQNKVQSSAFTHLD